MFAERLVRFVGTRISLMEDPVRLAIIWCGGMCRCHLAGLAELVHTSHMNCSLSAVWYGTGDLRLEERALPSMGSTDVVVDVVGCGVCATDLHLLDGSITLYQPPKVLGHEVGGVVREIGDRVTHVAVGDAVALD